MHFLTKQQIGALAIVSLINVAACTPITEAKDRILDTRQAIPVPYLMLYPSPDYTPARLFQGESEPEARRGQGDCQNLKVQNQARSAKAFKGWKCTMYEKKGCHGKRTREFNVDGIPLFEATMSAWRCCELGKTNYWGKCEDTLAAGT